MRRVGGCGLKKKGMKIEDIQGYDDYYVLSGGLEASPGPLERKTNHLLAKKILGR